MQEVNFVQIISKYVPISSISKLWYFFDNNIVDLKITRDRVTKYGDFRHPNPVNSMPRITVNGGLNQYSFLITLLHEIAHYKVYNDYNKTKKPHGIEWKKAFQQTVVPFINSGVFPQPLEGVFRQHMQNPRASTHSDINLLRCLNLYDKSINNNTTNLEDIPNGEKFAFKGRVFEKGEKRRTRFMCKDMNNNNKYTINALAKVEKI
ncbi:MAG: hypothetical protein KAG84_07360 [Bacteroidales bacterium]|nr:hypothetical protein [Bacteroidales bacterium]